MLKIAVFMAGLRFESQRTILQGIIEEANKKAVLLTIFSCDVWTMSDVAHMRGEMSVLNLPELTDFDGVIIHTGSFNNDIVEKEFLVKVKELGIPLVSIGTDIEDICNIRIDNEEAEFDLVEHLITKHKVKKFGVITGPSDNRESGGRMKGFRRALACYGIPWDELYTYVGNYHPDSGMLAFGYFLKLPDGLPEAIVAFNDEMAMGAMLYAKKKGLEIPKDLIVTGFDELFVSRFYHPSITTVRRNDKTLGEIALDRCLDIFEGKAVPDTEKIKAEAVFAESCGCTDDRPSMLHEAANRYSTYKLDNTTYVEVIKSSIADFANVADYRGFITVMKKYINIIEAKAIFLCLRAEHDHEKSYIAAARISGKFIQQHHEFFETKHLLPDQFKSVLREECDVIVPLHNGDKQFGHLVLRNCMTLADNDVFGIFISALDVGLERLYSISKD